MKVRSKAPWYVAPAKQEVPHWPPKCRSCKYLSHDVRRGLTFCEHKDAHLYGPPGYTAENTGYSGGVQPRPCPTWCPLLDRVYPPWP